MGENSSDEIKISKATWMFDGSYWPGTWEVSGEDDHSRGDHVGIIQVSCLFFGIICVIS